ncbi:MAG: hypothetical protein KAV00_02840 [Phycisphaerae bacterium]|nr:hypothetical protein [Phycisphaerae bacterium]
MTRTSTKSETARRGLLAVLMLAVLLASVSIAWLLERKSTIKAHAGAQIIGEIRAKGLKHYWPEKSQIDWFLIQSNGNTIGWKASVRVKSAARPGSPPLDKLGTTLSNAEGPKSDGNFIGVDVEVVPKQHSLHEIWTLNADATAGTYHADLRSAGGKGFKTDILLNDGMVKVVQHVRGIGSITADSRAPKNYLPKGTLHLAVRQTAEMRANAQFVMVFNERPNRDKAVEFGTLRLRYLGSSQTRQGRTVRRVRMSEIRGRGKRRTLFELDEKGKILLIQGEKTQSKAVDEQTIKKSFADAPLYLRRLLKQAGGH